MSDRRAGSQPNDPRLLPVLVSVGYVATLIAVWGFTSLLLDRDIITESDAGPLLGPAMAVTAAAVVSLSLWRLRRRTTLLSPTIGTAASVYVLMLLVGAVGYSVTQGNFAWLVLFTARYAVSPFIVGAALLAGLSVVFLWAVTIRERRDAQDHRTP